MSVNTGGRLYAPIVLSFRSNLLIALAALLLGGAAILYYSADDPAFHTVLDTSVTLTGALVALLLWDISRRSSQSLPLLLAVSFAFLAFGEFVHTLAALGWIGGTGDETSAVAFRAGTWGPPAHLLPIGVGASLLLRKSSRSSAWLLALGLVALAAILVGIFLLVPRYAEPGLLGITRPTLVLVPFLWAAVGIAYWRHRDETEIARAMALTAVVLAIAHATQLYSRAPSDAVAMVAHLGKFIGDALLLFNLTQIGAADTARRREAEGNLTQLNQELDRRVTERTARLQEINERMHLLDQITRAIGQRHDVGSIFQVVVRALEEQLPADFVCICRCEADRAMLRVAHVGVHSSRLGTELGMPEGAEIAIDANGLSRCVRGELVHEPDLAEVAFPFPQRLAAHGLRSLVFAPLAIEGEVFGVVVASRLKANAFLSTDCEFLGQLGEHVGLAAHQTQLRDRLQEAYDDLRQTQQTVLQQERLRALGQMASGIAHDINNAISPVAVYTKSLLEREPDLPQRVRDYLEIVGRVVKDVSATVARMRDFYRRDETASELEPLDLNQLVPQVVDLTRARWSDMPQQRGVVIRVTTELEAGLPPVMGNASELREAATNLIFNAVDAMPEGGTIGVRTRSARSSSGLANHVVLEIADSGVGMDEETRRRCLEPFFTTKGERGTGLGLAMVYGAAQRHHAALGIDSAPGKGTRVSLEFAAAPAQPAPDAAAAPGHTSKALRLLLVDDDPAVLKSTQMVLELDGHSIATADGGQAALEALKQARDTPFDVVVTDLGMPHVDGNQVAQKVKEFAPSTTVVLLTGWGRRMGEREPANVDYVLPKPLDLDELRQIFAELPGRTA